MPNTPQAETPFLIEHHQQERTLSGAFRPDARLVLLPALRTSGLWTALAPEDIKNLLLLLTFLSPNGNCHPAVTELAEAMQVSQAKARSRMLRLIHQQWHGQSLVTEMPHPTGLDTYAPGRHLLAHEQIPPTPAAAVPALIAAGREAVIMHSRTSYATPRAEVEREIDERMGWGLPTFDGEDPAVAEGKRQAFGQMTAVGVAREQALDLLSRFDLARIERQLTWLPARHAKSPSRFLVAAITGDYEAPVAVRLQQTPNIPATSPAPTEAVVMEPPAQAMPILLGEQRDNTDEDTGENEAWDIRSPEERIPDENTPNESIAEEGAQHPEESQHVAHEHMTLTPQDPATRDELPPLSTEEGQATQVSATEELYSAERQATSDQAPSS